MRRRCSARVARALQLGDVDAGRSAGCPAAANVRASPGRAVRSTRAIALHIDVNAREPERAVGVGEQLDPAALGDVDARGEHTPDPLLQLRRAVAAAGDGRREQRQR